MSLTTKQILFFFFFLVSWLLLLLLGESYLSYVLLGGVSFLFLFFSSELEWHKINNYQWLFVLWLLVFLGMGLSLFFSISLPLSLYSMTRFIFASLVFWFFLLVKKSFISAQQVVKILLLVSLVIILISTSFQLFPNLENLLPGMNLLHATYGHNHLAALLLLVVPLSWWLSSEYVKSGQSHWWWLMPLIFNLGLLFSFGRVAVAIGLVQFLFIFWQLKKNGFIKNRPLKFLLKSLVGLFLIILLSNIFFSTATLINSDFSCPVPSLGRQLCKSIATESRPEYWQWAVEITKNNFWLGSGPGTFSLAAKKYYLNPFSGSSYAHNAFLESLAEIGLIGGGLFIVLMFGLLYSSWKNLGKRKNWNWKMAAFLGLAAIYADVLFDFDWEFISIFSITLLLLALILKDKKVKLVKDNFSNFFKTIYFTLIFFLILVVGLYLKADGLIKADRIQAAFELFPYFHWHRKIYENSPSLNTEDRKKFYKIYQLQPAVYTTWLTETKNKQQHQQIKEHWFEIDPWAAVNQDLTSYYLDQNDLKQVEIWLQKEQRLYEQVREQGYELDYEVKISFGERSLALAQAYLEFGDMDSALKWFEIILSESNTQVAWEQQELIAQLLVEIGNDFVTEDIVQTIRVYELAKQEVPWALSSNEQWFEKYPQSELSLADLIQYLELTAGWQGEDIGWKDKAQYALAHQAVEKLIAASDWQNLAKISEVFHWDEHDYQPRLELIKKISLKSDQLVKQDDYKLASQLTQAMNLILPNNYWLMSQPGHLAILLEDYDQDEVEVLQIIANTKNRYFQVSRIIRGEEAWQDFTK
jgi:FimV-like protein